MESPKSPPDNRLAGPIRSLLERGTATGASETELLDLFVSDRDESAFAILVDRHGPMVLGVCRRFLSDPQDVEDAFQATFLVLIRRAGSLSQKELLGNWLYGVAIRVARRASRLGAVRRSRFAAAGGMEAVGPGTDRAGPDPRDHVLQRLEQGPLIHEEIHRLPPKYRTPILLCYFEGLTHDEAAMRLGWPVGTVKGRLSRARDLLRPRLVRRGITAPAAIAALLTSLEVRAAVPEALARSAVRSGLAAVDVARGCPAAMSAVSLPVRHLTEGVSLAMFLFQIRSMVAPALIAAGIVTGGMVLSSRLSGAQAGLSPVQKKDGPGPNSITPSPARPKSAEPKIKASGDTPASGAGAGAVGGMMAGGIDPAQGGFGGGGGEDTDPNGSRIIIARLSAKIASTDKNPRNQAILKKLDDPVTLRFPSETPLEEVLKRIKDSAKSSDGKPLPIYVDPNGLAEADKTLTSPVVIDLEDIPLRFSLRLVLKQLGMAYCVRDGVVIISSVEGIQQELMEALAEQQMIYPKEYPIEPGSGGMMRGMPGGMGGMGGQGGFR